MSKTPTAAELKARAKDGYFFEYWLKSWVPTAEVSTPTTARRYLWRKNPLNVCALARQVIGEGDRITIISYRSLFWLSLLVAVILSTFVAVPAIKGVDIDLYINRYPFAYGVAALIGLLHVFGCCVLMFCSYKEALEDACFALSLHVAKFKEGLVYDYNLGEWISFQE